MLAFLLLAIEMGIRQLDGSNDENPEFGIQKADFVRWFNATSMDDTV
jgi:hypothetical protein